MSVFCLSSVHMHTVCLSVCLSICLYSQCASSPEYLFLFLSTPTSPPPPIHPQCGSSPEETGALQVHCRTRKRTLWKGRDCSVLLSCNVQCFPQSRVPPTLSWHNFLWCGHVFHSSSCQLWSKTHVFGLEVCYCPLHSYRSD